MCLVSGYYSSHAFFLYTFGVKRLYLLLSLSYLSACSFAPLTLSVPDFTIPSGSTASIICYSKVSKSISVSFASVVYEADALYKPNQGLGDNSTINLSFYGRATDPNPELNTDIKCVSASASDLLLSDTPVNLRANTSQRISVGGSTLASLVTQKVYWLGGSLNDGSLGSLPGSIDFSKGLVKANF